MKWFEDCNMSKLYFLLVMVWSLFDLWFELSLIHLPFSFFEMALKTYYTFHSSIALIYLHCIFHRPNCINCIFSRCLINVSLLFMFNLNTMPSRSGSKCPRSDKSVMRRNWQGTVESEILICNYQGSNQNIITKSSLVGFVIYYTLYSLYNSVVRNKEWKCPFVFAYIFLYLRNHFLITG